MVWSTRTLGRDRDYVVIKHKLSGINGLLCGVKFRDGYGVVEKGSKLYLQLRSLPFVKGQPEYPLIHLRKLPFVTRTQDVQTIYGQDIYVHYLKQLNPVVQDETIERQEAEYINHISTKCPVVTQLGKLCAFAVVPGSPSGHCKHHILSDPKLVDLGIIVPERLTRQEKSELKDKICEKLAKLPKNPRTKKEDQLVEE
jgi:hypothetical protein